MTLIQFLLVLDQHIYFDDYPSLIIKSKPNSNIFICTGKFGFFILHSYIIQKYLINSQNQNLFSVFKSYLKQLFYGLEYTFYTVLLLKGIGFRFELKQTKNLKKKFFKFRAGYHLPITFKFLTNNFNLFSPKPTRIIINSNNWQHLYLLSKNIKNYRIPDNYKNKGLVYRYEKILKKIVRKTK